MTALKKLNLAHVFNDCDFGGYLIANGVASFVDGRTELMRTQSAATILLDHIDGWQKVYTDDIATIHVRKSGAVHIAEPVVSAVAK